MTTTPMEPHGEPDRGIPAADAGPGALEPAAGYGVEGDDPRRDDEREPEADDS